MPRTWAHKISRKGGIRYVDAQQARDVCRSQVHIGPCHTHTAFPPRRHVYTALLLHRVMHLAREPCTSSAPSVEFKRALDHFLSPTPAYRATLQRAGISIRPELAGSDFSDPDEWIGYMHAGRSRATCPGRPRR